VHSFCAEELGAQPSVAEGLSVQCQTAQSSNKHNDV
jgi:hypothetical protein